jgi:tetratricopeptide (TPR) repeat protein
MKASPRLKYVLLGFAAVIVVVVGGLMFERSWRLTHSGTATPQNLVLHVDRGLSPADKAALQARIDAEVAAIAADDKAGTPDLTKVLLLGNYYYEIGDLDNAAKTYRSILATHPKDTPSYENLGQVQLEEGDYAGAEASWKAAVDISPYEPTYLKLVDLIDKHFPDQNASIETILESAIGNLGQTPGLLTRLGDWYAEKGNLQEAISHYEVAHQLAPDDTSIAATLTSLRAKLAAQTPTK